MAETLTDELWGPPPWFETPEVDPSRFNILLWNVWYRARDEPVLATIKTLNCELLVLQELRIELVEQIANLGYHGYFVECRQFKGIREGSAIFSRWPLREPFFVPVRRGGRALLRGGPRSRRCYLEAGIALPEQKHFVIGMAHLSYGFIGGGRMRCNEITKICGELEEHSEGFVFLGDFNAKPDSPTVQRVGSILKHIGPPPHEPSSYWPFMGTLVGRRVDWAFATKDVRAHAWFGDRGPSDHRTLIVEVRT